MRKRINKLLEKHNYSPIYDSDMQEQVLYRFMHAIMDELGIKPDEDRPKFCAHCGRKIQ